MKRTASGRVLDLLRSSVEPRSAGLTRALAVTGRGCRLDIRLDNAVAPSVEKRLSGHLPVWRRLDPQAQIDANWTIVADTVPSLPRLDGADRLIAHSLGAPPVLGTSFAVEGWDGVQNQRSGVVVALEFERRRLTALCPHEALARGAAVDVQSAVRHLLRWETEAAGGAVVHAAAVRAGDQGALIAGPKGSGKTTLQLALIWLAGAAYVSSDRTFVEIRQAVPVLSPWPSTFRPTAATLTLFEDFAKLAGAPDRQAEKLDLELSQLQRAGVATASSTSADVLIFPRYEHTPIGVGLLTSDEAATRLLAEWTSPNDATFPYWLAFPTPSKATALATIDSLAELPAFAVHGEGAPHTLVATLRRTLAAI